MAPNRAETDRNRVAGEKSERRQLRFAVSLPVEYVWNGRRGTARTRNMGSGGVFIEGSEILAPGAKVDLSIDWPAVLDGRCLLRLAVRGKVLRSSTSGTAIRILKYEYRVRSQTSAHAARSLIARTAFS